MARFPAFSIFIETNNRRATMRIHQLSLQGITEAFRERITVDFEALGPGLIAIVGENGVGKSTLLGSIFSNQHRTGNFLSLERSQRKELFITQLLGLQRLRLISATARGFADERGKEVLVLEGEKRGISQVLVNESELDDVEKLGLQLEALGSRLQGLEKHKSELE